MECQSPLFPRLAAALVPVWHRGGHAREGLYWMRSALESASDRRDRCLLSAGLGVVLARSGDIRSARPHLLDAIALSEQVGDTNQTALHWSRLAELESVSGERAFARRCVARAMDAATRSPDPRVLVNAGVALARTDTAEKADEVLSRSMASSLLIGDTKLWAIGLVVKARIRAGSGDAVAAPEMHREALAVGFGDVLHTMITLAGVSLLMMQLGATRRGLRLASAVDAACADQGFDRQAVWRSDRPVIEAAVGSLAPDGGAAAYTAGQRITLDQAWAYALEDRDE